MFQPFGIANIIYKKGGGGDGRREEEKTCFRPATLLTDKRKGVAQKKAHPEIPALSSWNFYYWFVPLLPRSSPQKERKTKGGKRRERGG